MRLRVTPRVDARYWTAILFASMCGTNFGDFLPDVLRLGTGASMVALAGLFAAILLAERASARGAEVFYWLALLVVRAAATMVADYSIDQRHLGYVPVCVALAVGLASLLAGHQRYGPAPGSGSLPAAGPFYWFTMLVAGALGTVLGDGMGHAFGPVQVGVPISAGLATLAMAAVLGVRGRQIWTSPASYWVAVVVVRWWGTNFGDISKFLLSLPVSMAATGVALALMLLIWRERTATRGAVAASMADR